MKKNEYSIKRHTWILFITNAFVYLTGASFFPFIGAYYSDKGISVTHIGILLAISPIVTILVQPQWARLSDYTGRRIKTLVVIILGSSISVLAYYLGNNFIGFFIITIIFSSFYTAIIPLSDAIIINQAKKNGINFAYIRIGGAIAFAIVVYIAGYIIKSNTKAMFLMTSISYFILALISRKLPTENHILTTEKYTTKEQNKKKTNINKTKTNKLYINKDIIMILMFASVNFVGLSFGPGFIGVYLIELGYNQSTIGIVNTISALSEVLVLLLINKIIRKLETIKILSLAGILTGVRLILIAHETVPSIIFSQLLHGITYMTTYYCCVTFINDSISSEHISKGQSLITIVQTGFGSVIGVVIGGRIIGAIGLQNSYMIVGSISIGISVILALIYRVFYKK